MEKQGKDSVAGYDCDLFPNRDEKGGKNLAGPHQRSKHKHKHKKLVR